MDAQTDRHGGDDPVAHDIESRNPDSGDIVAGEQVLDEGHVAPDQDAGPSHKSEGSGSSSGSGGGPIEGVPEGDPESAEERRDGADERTDPAAPPAQEPPG